MITAELIMLGLSGLFALLLLFGFIGGLIRGFKKTVFQLIFVVVFWAGFFLSIAPATAYILELPIIDYVRSLANLGPEYDTCNTIYEFFAIVMGNFGIDVTTSPELANIVMAIVDVVANILYLLVYYVVAGIVIGFIQGFIWFTFFAHLRTKAEKKAMPKMRMLGGVMGIVKAAPGLIFGCIMLNALTGIIPYVTLDNSGTSTLSADNASIDSPELRALIDQYGLSEYVKFINLYKDSAYTTVFDSVKITQGEGENAEQVSINDLVLDQIFVGQYGEGEAIKEVDLRSELGLFLNVGVRAYAITGGQFDYTQLTEQQLSDVVGLVGDLAESNLLVDLIPVAINVAFALPEVVEALPEGVDIDVAVFDDINWANDITQLAAFGQNIVELTNGFDFENFNPLEDDPEQVEAIQAALTAVSNIQSLMVLIPIAVDYALNMPDVQTQLGDLADTIRPLLDEPEEVAAELENFGDIYAAFLDIGFTAVDNIMNEFLQLTQDQYTAVESLIDVIFTSAMVSEMMPAVLNMAVSQLDENIREMFDYTEAGISGSDDWKQEFLCIVGVAKDLSSGEYTLADMMNGTFTPDMIANISVDRLLTSKLLKHAFKTLLEGCNTEGSMGYELGLGEFIAIPDDKYDATSNPDGWKWEDTMDGDVITKPGELRLTFNMLKLAVAALGEIEVPEGETLGFDQLPSVIFSLDDKYFADPAGENGDDSIFASKVILCSVTKLVSTMLTGENDVLVIPSTAYDSGLTYNNTANQAFSALELSSLALGIKGLDLDITSLETGMPDTGELLGAFKDDLGNVNEDLIDTLLSSEILRFTISNILFDLGDTITIPEDTLTTVEYDGTLKAIQEEELANLFKVALNLDLDTLITGGEEIDVDTVLNSFKNDEGGVDDTKIDSITNSNILRATITKYVLDAASTTIIVPNDTTPTTGVLEAIGNSPTMAIQKAELSNLFTAVLSLDLDFSGEMDPSSIVSSLEIKDELDQPTGVPDTVLITDLVQSKILRATITNLLAGVDVVKIPDDSAETTPVVMEIVGNSTSKAILSTEISKLIAGVITLNITSMLDESAAALEVSTIMNNLKTDLGAPDETKITTLTSSIILRCTMFSFVSDVGDVIVIPEDTLGTIEYYADGTNPDMKSVQQTELTNVVKAIINLNIDLSGEIDASTIFAGLEDVDGNPDTDKINSLTASNIMRATISNTLSTVDAVVVPNDTTNVYDLIGNSTTYAVKTTELNNLITGVITLDLSSMLAEGNSVDADAIMNNLKTGGVADTVKIGKLTSSIILRCTMYSFVGTASDMIVIPEDTIGTVEYFDDGANPDIKSIRASELSNLIEAVITLDLDLTAGVDASTIFTNLEDGEGNPDDAKITALTDSNIMRATITNTLNSVDSVVIPQDQTNVIAQVGNSPFYAVNDDELNKLISGIITLDLGDILASGSGFDADVVMTNLTNGDGTPNTGKITTLTDSIILRCTMYSFIGDASALIVIPQDDEGTVEYWENGANPDVESIQATELSNLIKAVITLDLDLTAGIDASTIFTSLEDTEGAPDTAKIGVLTSSNIMRATITNTIQSVDAVVLPMDETNVVEVIGSSTTYAIQTTELNNLISGIITLDLGNMLASGSTLDVSGIMNNLKDTEGNPDTTKITTLTASNILRCTMYSYIGDASAMIVIPEDTLGTVEYFDDGANPDVKSVRSAELTNLIEAVINLNLDLAAGVDASTIFTHLEDVDGNPDNAKILSLTDSNIMRATITNTIESVEAVIAPYDTTNVYAQIGNSPTYAIRNTELNNLITGIITLDLGDMLASGSTLDITGVLDNLKTTSGGLPVDGSPDTDKIDDLVTSIILRCTMFSYIKDASTLIIVPEDDVGTVEWFENGADPDVECIMASELENLFIAVITIDLDLTGTIDASTIFTKLETVEGAPDSGKINKLTASNILRATISDTIFKVDAVVTPMDTTNVVEYIGTSTTYAVQTSELNNLITGIITLDLGEMLTSGSTLEINGVLDNLKTTSGGLPVDGSPDTDKIDDLVTSIILRCTMFSYIKDASALIIVPEDNVGTVEYYDDGTDPDVECIKSEELKNLFIAVITIDLDLTGTIDASTIFTKLETVEGAPDSGKINKLTASNILRATISDTIFKVDAVITPMDTASVVEYVGSSTTYAVQTSELNNLITGIITLDLGEMLTSGSTLDITGVLDNLKTTSGGLPVDGSPDTDKIDDLVTSIILRCTMFSYIKDASAMIIVPEDDVGTVEWFENGADPDVECIMASELENLFIAVITIDLDLTGTIDASTIFTKLETVEGAPDTGKINKLTASNILRATISDTIFKVDAVITPMDTTSVVEYVGTSTTYAIQTVELNNLISGIITLNLGEMLTSGSTLEITGVLDNLKTTSGGLPVDGSPDTAKIDILVASNILRCTMYSYIGDITGVIVIPNDSLGTIETFDDGADPDVTSIQDSELANLFIAVIRLDLDLNGTIDASTLFSKLETTGGEPDSVKISSLTNSNILRATISARLLDVSAVVVPNDFTNVRELIGNSPTEAIKTSELTNLIEGVITVQMDAMLSGGAFNISNILDNLKTTSGGLPVDGSPDTDKIETLSLSIILRATMYKYIDDTGDVVIIPDDTTANVGVIQYYDVKKAIQSLELQNLINASITLDIDLGGALNATGLIDSLKDGEGQADSAKVNKIVSSGILRATVSDKIMAVPTIIVPDDSEVLAVVGNSTTKAIITSELTAFFTGSLSLDLDLSGGALGGSVINSLEDPLNPGTADDEKVGNITASIIMRCTISDIIIDVGDPIIIPTDLVTTIEKFDDGLDPQVTSIQQLELSNLLGGIISLGIDFTNPSIDPSMIFGKITLGATYATDSADGLDDILVSNILHCSISKVVTDLDDGTGSATVIVPEVSGVYETIGNLTNVVTESEIKQLMISFKALAGGTTDFGLVDFNSLSGSIIGNESNTQRISSSTIVRATVSYQISSVSSIDVPDDAALSDGIFAAVDGGRNAYKVITKNEMISLFDSFGVLGIDDFTSAFSFESVVNLGAPASNDDLETLLASIIMWSSASIQLDDTADTPANALFIPLVVYTPVTGYSEPDRITRAELKQFIQSVYAVNPAGGFDLSSGFGFSDLISKDLDVITTSKILSFSVGHSIQTEAASGSLSGVITINTNTAANATYLAGEYIILSTSTDNILNTSTWYAWYDNDTTANTNGQLYPMLLSFRRLNALGIDINSMSGINVLNINNTVGKTYNTYSDDEIYITDNKTDLEEFSDSLTDSLIIRDSLTGFVSTLLATATAGMDSVTGVTFTVPDGTIWETDYTLGLDLLNTTTAQSINKTNVVYGEMYNLCNGLQALNVFEDLSDNPGITNITRNDSAAAISLKAAFKTMNHSTIIKPAIASVIHNILGDTLYQAATGEPYNENDTFTDAELDNIVEALVTTNAANHFNDHKTEFNTVTTDGTNFEIATVDLVDTGNATLNSTLNTYIYDAICAYYDAVLTPFTTGEKDSIYLGIVGEAYSAEVVISQDDVASLITYLKNNN